MDIHRGIPGRSVEANAVQGGGSESHANADPPGKPPPTQAAPPAKAVRRARGVRTPEASGAAPAPAPGNPRRKIPGLSPATSWAENLDGCAVRLLSGLSGQPEHRLVEKLVAEFRRWVFDLPASERYHHARPRGLAEHSLEVGVGSLGQLAHRWVENACNGFVPAEELPGLSRAAFAVGLLHDCGRLLDLEVSVPPGPPWDPREESLAQFRSRVGLREEVTTPHRFLRGRTLQGHELRGADLIGRFLGAQFSEDLDPEVVKNAYLAYVLRHDPRVWSLPTPLLYLGNLVKRADEMSVREDRWKHRRAPAESGGEAMREGSS